MFDVWPGAMPGLFYFVKEMLKYLIFPETCCIFVSSITTKTKVMKNEIIYKNRSIIENTDGTFSAFYSNYSSHLVKTFKTLAAAKKQIDKWA